MQAGEKFGLQERDLEALCVPTHHTFRRHPQLLCSVSDTQSSGWRERFGRETFMEREKEF